MASNTFGQKNFNPAPPVKGSFPLDHEGECKRFMLRYMICLRENNNQNSKCREVSKDYLDCRMQKQLMVKEDWAKLGFGSVATIKVNELVDQLKTNNFEVQTIATKSAQHFLKADTIDCKVWSDEDEWDVWKDRAPLDANSLAKIAQGICDNLLTCTVRAWDLAKPLLFCPAMNTHMWNHPLTAEHINKLKAFGYIEIPCISKTLICGDSGTGAMAEIKTIVDQVVNLSKGKV
ncbi:Phosphopantothenoylcysteine decarboxylase [Daphnia magna]|uniref:Phosphopantothenoylcysteine decarboxylase n=1 Tax=Daphnia magna TaxID=35525 RepID=A0A162P3C9_9CRUS|nr:Phosphopantothenoylcysteine decarboxylase [Daphnia magna]